MVYIYYSETSDQGTPQRHSKYPHIEDVPR